MPDEILPLSITNVISSKLKDVGAEGIFALRGLSKVTLTYSFDDEPETPLTMEIVPPGVLLLAMMPDDGGEPGVESH